MLKEQLKVWELKLKINKILLMGQKRIKVVSKESKPKKEESKEKKIRVAGLKGGDQVKVVEAEPVKLPEEKPVQEEEKKVKRSPKVRGKKYLAAKTKIDQNKLYPLTEAIKLVKETSITKFVGNLEVHLVVKQTGELGELNLPYFKGKTKKVVVADDQVIEQIKANKIDFDVLLASPKMMPKLIPFARILGPKGLMPNPKNGTLVKDPEKAIKQFSKNTIKVKTERKAPVVHLVLGKLDQPDKELIANVEALIKLFGPGQIKKMVLKATMGPGVKVKV